MTSKGKFQRLRLVTTELVAAAEAGPKVIGPETAGEELCHLIGSKDREHFVVLYLNTKNHIVSAETVSIGTISATLVHPREIFKGAILANAAAIIGGHNHPSGDLSPSREDIEICGRLQDAGRLVGIDLLDMLIVSGENWISLREEGALE